MIFKTLLAGVLSLALSNCAGTVSTPAADSATFSAVAYTCSSATAALKTAIKFNAMLTPANRANVTKAATILNPICSQDPVPTVSTTAKAALDIALAQLTTAAAQVIIP